MRLMDHDDKPLGRANELDDLLTAVKALIIPFVKAADDAAVTPSQSQLGEAPLSGTSLVKLQTPQEVKAQLQLSLPDAGQGRDGLLRVMEQILDNSVNTWDQGFLDKLYSGTNAVGVASELLLAVLNTNLHVFQVSPALTLVEKTTGHALARRFGLDGRHAGGVTMSGGSAANMTSIIIARNTLYPDTKRCGSQGHHFVLYTSAHGHYSVEKAAQACGIGSDNVVSVPVDAVGKMIPLELRKAISKSKTAGHTPLYVNATAGTTVLGSYDGPLEDISAICKEFNLWMHIDGSWGGPAIFSKKHCHNLRGSHLADSITVNPHKMMNVPVTCSFLLGPDMRIFHKANTLPAGYLFHDADPDSDAVDGDEAENWDLADLTLQCGRRGDSLKLALAWIYYGATGFEEQIDHAFEVAAYLAEKIAHNADFRLVSANPPPCLQVCFYYDPAGVDDDQATPAISAADMTRRTAQMTRKLILRGFMVDYAPGDRGSFFRVVINCQTLYSTADRLVIALEQVGREVCSQHN